MPQLKTLLTNEDRIVVLLNVATGVNYRYLVLIESKQRPSFFSFILLQVNIKFGDNTIANCKDIVRMRIGLNKGLAKFTWTTFFVARLMEASKVSSTNHVRSK